jgi:glycosyltransferase involved in cell wall biosynthesis
MADVDLVVLVNGFPRLSETFVLEELLDLERRGLRLRVIALSSPGELVEQEAVSRLRAEVEYVPERQVITRTALARASLALLRRRRTELAPAVAEIVNAPDFTRGALQRAAVLAARLVALGSPPLYIHFAHKPGTVGRFAARLAGVPYALSCHAKDIWLTAPEELAAKLRGAEVVLTCTEAGRLELARHAAGATPVVLAYHGVDVDVPAVRREPAGPPRILTVGRLVEKKGHDTLIRSAALLRDRGVDFTLRIAGEGVEWPRLQRLVHELGASGHVMFLGPLSPAEVGEEYEAATAFALACRTLSNGDRDGLPNAVLEAMVRGLPIVSTSQAGVAEAIERERSGLLVEPDDPAALADALERVLTDPGYATELGQGARAAVRGRFDRVRLLPSVAAALAQAGLISPAAAAAPPGREDVEREELEAA